MKRIKKLKRLFPTNKGKEVAPYILAENAYSNAVALNGLSKEEAEVLSDLLEKVRENIEVDWNAVKKGQKRNYNY